MKDTSKQWEIKTEKINVHWSQAIWMGNEIIAQTNATYARLIAKAPEMEIEIDRLKTINADLLDICKALASSAVWDGKTREFGSQNEYSVNRAVIDAAQRAIAKATEGRE